MSLIQEWSDMLTLSLNHGLDCKLVWSNGPKGLAHRLKDPPSTLTLIFWPETTSLDFIHMLIKKSVKRRAKTCRTQAGRPTNYQLKTKATIHRHLEKIRSVHEKVGTKRTKSQAGRPHFAASRPHLHVEVKHNHYNCVQLKLGQILTLEHYK